MFLNSTFFINFIFILQFLFVVTWRKNLYDQIRGSNTPSIIQFGPVTNYTDIRLNYRKDFLIPS